MKYLDHLFRNVILLAVWLAISSSLSAQTLDEELKQIPAAELASAAKAQGDAARGAVVFFQQHMACAKCHAIGRDNQQGLGPDLTALGKSNAKTVTDEMLVESVLFPSKSIRTGFETATILRTDGQTVTALLVERSKEKVVVRDVARNGEVDDHSRRGDRGF